MKQMSKKEYFPNNWKRYKNAPDEAFQTLTFSEFHDWRVCSWDIPEDVQCILRVSRVDTGKVKEYVYKTQRGAIDKLNKLIEDPLNEITICDNDEIRLIRSVLDQLIDDEED